MIAVGTDALRDAEVARLVGDIGATNARFALADATGAIMRARVLACEDYPSLEAAMTAYLADESIAPPREACLAVASPVVGDVVTLTNNPWSFSIAAVRGRFGLSRLLVVNDFTANALAVPRLGTNDRFQIGGVVPVREAPIAVIGPGSGLGMSALVPTRDGWVVLPSEGGHATMAPGDARESQVLDRMRQRYDHVSAERVLSGPGLVNLYNVLCEIEGVKAAPFQPAQITDPRIAKEDPRCAEAVAMFCAMLGTVAGNLALTLGARGGLYIAGGIVPKLGNAFAASAFRARFEAKGRLRAYLAEIPSFVITHPVPAFLGAVSALEQSPGPSAQS